MTRPTPAVRRMALPLSAALIGGAVVALGASSPAQASGGTQIIDNSSAYTCNVMAGTLNLHEHNVGVRTETVLPKSVYRGEKIAPTAVKITLTMPETLRQPTVDLLGGTDASGSSTDAAVTLTSAGSSLAVKIPSLSAPKTAIPQTAGSPWLIPATGTVPAITTPSTVSGSVAVTMPAHFTVKATLFSPDAPGGTVPATLDCSIGTPARLGTMGVVAAPVQANRAPKFAKASYPLVTKKNKAKSIKVVATDPDKNKLTYKLAKKTTKGKVTVKGTKVTFKPKKNWKGKTSFVVSVSDGKLTAKTTVKVTVKK